MLTLTFSIDWQAKLLPGALRSSTFIEDAVDLLYTMRRWAEARRASAHGLSDAQLTLPQMKSSNPSTQLNYDCVGSHVMYKDSIPCIQYKYT